MPFNSSYKGYYQYDRFMLTNVKPWSDRDGDALWRTAIAYICYGEHSLYMGILSCIEDKPVRFPYDKDKEPELYQWARDTVSRDQVAMACTALRWGHTNLPDDTELEITIPFFLSKKHWLTPDLWLWLRKHYKLWTLLIIMQFLIIIPWNKLWRPIYRRFGTGWAGKLIYPHYSLFITAFMLAVVPDGKLTDYARKLLRKDVEDSNLVLQMILGRWPSIFSILEYEAKSFRWNRRLDEPSDVYEPENRALEYNNIDIDLIYAALKWGYRKNIEKSLDFFEDSL